MPHVFCFTSFQEYRFLHFNFSLMASPKGIHAIDADDWLISSPFSKQFMIDTLLEHVKL